jgi:hypothetical protein
VLINPKYLGLQFCFPKFVTRFHFCRNKYMKLLSGLLFVYFTTAIFCLPLGDFSILPQPLPIFSPGELARLERDEVRIVPAGLRVVARGGPVIVPPGSAPELCAVQAWKEWRAAVGTQRGAAFRPIDRHGRIADDGLSVRGVTRIVQRAVARAGYDGARYSGRSLRRGMVLAATEHGASERGIMAQTGHRSRRLVRRYMTESGR